MFWPIVAVISFVIAPQMGWWFPYTHDPNSVLQGKSGSPLGVDIDNLFYLILVITTVTFIGTHIALGYVLATSRTPESGKKVWFSHGSHNLEVIWTIAPAGILLFIALYQLDVWAQYRVISNFPEEAREAPIAEVTARQFEWRIRYPAPGKKLQLNPQPDDLYAVNDLRIPTNRPVMIQLRSGDVQHSFFVPELRVKQDAVPGLVIPVWFEATVADDFELVCAELCGWGHYKMGARVVAQPKEDFERYLLELQQEQNYDGVSKPADPAMAQKD
jgi:cytochrome c oxidase subunit 2